MEIEVWSDCGHNFEGSAGHWWKILWFQRVHHQDDWGVRKWSGVFGTIFNYCVRNYLEMLITPFKDWKILSELISSRTLLSIRSRNDYKFF